MVTAANLTGKVTTREDGDGHAPSEEKVPTHGMPRAKFSFGLECKAAAAKYSGPAKSDTAVAPAPPFSVSL